MIRTLVLSLVCSLALLPRAGAAASPVEDQKQDESSLQSTAWLRQAHMHIIENGPPLARALAITRTSGSLGFSSEADQAIAAEAFAELLSADGLSAQTLWVLVHLCQRSPYSSQCEIEGVRERLVAAAPDNAAVYLIPDPQGAPGSGLSPVIPRPRLLKAALATHYDIYWGRNGHLVFDLAMETVAQNPHPDEVEAGPRHWQAFWLVTSLMGANPQFSGAIYQSCKESVQSRDQQVADACYQIARLMKDYGTTTISRTLGFGQERALMLHEDPDSEAALRLWREQRMDEKVRTCLAKGAWPNPLTMLYLTAQDFRDMLQQLSEEGQLPWVEFRADQEYARNPGAWERSPDECRAMRGLEGQALIAELGELDPYDLWLQVGERIRASTTDRP